MLVCPRTLGSQARPLILSAVDIGKESRAAALALLAYDHREPRRLSSLAWTDSSSTVLTLDLEVCSRIRAQRLYSDMLIPRADRACMEAEQALERSLAIHLRESNPYSSHRACWLTLPSESILPYGMAGAGYECVYLNVK